MTTPNELITIPRALLDAKTDKAAYFELINIYRDQYSCTSMAQAWDLLESNLARYDIAPVFMTYDAFMEAKRRFVRKILQKA